MVKLFETAYRMEVIRGVTNVPTFGGYPYADVAHAGLSIVVVTDSARNVPRPIFPLDEI